MEQYSTRSNHEIDYKIVGEEMQYVEIELDPNETAIAEAGSFMTVSYTHLTLPTKRIV